MRTAEMYTAVPDFVKKLELF